MLSSGERHDSPQGRILLAELDDSLAQASVLMDRAYEGDATRKQVVSQGMTPVVPPKSNRKNPWKYDTELYKRRNEVERFFRRIKASRRVFTRYDKLDTMYFSFVLIAIIYEFLRM